jgi:hypothetical protein
VSLIHIRNKELQTSTFTANPVLDQENGDDMHLEDGTTTLDLDGSASWTVQITHAPQLRNLTIMHVPEFFDTVAEFEYTLLNEDGEEILNEDSENILSESLDTWPTVLVHARRT